MVPGAIGMALTYPADAKNIWGSPYPSQVIGGASGEDWSSFRNPVQPDDRTPHPCPQVFQPAPRVHRRGGLPGLWWGFAFGFLGKVSAARQWGLWQEVDRPRRSRF
jgi:hypothetical protein